MAISDDFIARFPQFDPVDQDALDNAINEYQCYFNCEYGNDDCADAAILQLLAHMYVIETTPNNAPSKATASKAVGNVSVSYVQGATDSLTLYFNTTKYGQRFLQMTAKCGQGAFFV